MQRFGRLCCTGTLRQLLGRLRRRTRCARGVIVVVAKGGGRLQGGLGEPGGNLGGTPKTNLTGQGIVAARPVRCHAWNDGSSWVMGFGKWLARVKSRRSQKPSGLAFDFLNTNTMSITPYGLPSSQKSPECVTGGLRTGNDTVATGSSIISKMTKHYSPASFSCDRFTETP